MTGHYIERTSPKGGPFVGTCARCGLPNLTDKNLEDECANTTGMSDADALVAAIEGPLTQNHMAYPNITRWTLDAVGYNGGLHVLRAPEIGAEADVKRLLDEYLGAEGVYHDDLKALDDWLGTLTPEEFLTIADGEESESLAILTRAPTFDRGEGTVGEFLESLFEHCV